jgi:hypothetical protein
MAAYLTAIAVVIGGLALRLAVVIAPQEVEAALYTP